MLVPLITYLFSSDVIARHGGTAVDAAVAAMLCIGVVQLHSTGIGGGNFMNIYEAYVTFCIFAIMPLKIKVTRYICC